MSSVPANELQEDFTLLMPPEAIQSTAQSVQNGLSQQQYLMIVAAVAVVLLLGWAVFAWARRRRAQKAAEEAHLAALRELAEWRQLDDEDRYREAVAAISGTLRRYVEQRYGLRASSATTEEFWEQQNSNPKIPKVYDPFWQRFTSVGDLIKYAGDQPDTPQFKQLYTSSVEFVETSRAGRAASSKVAA